MRKTFKIIKFFLISVNIASFIYYSFIEPDFSTAFVSIMIAVFLISLGFKKSEWEKLGEDKAEKSIMRAQILETIFNEKDLEKCPGWNKWSDTDKEWAKEIYEKYTEVISKSNIN